MCHPSVVPAVPGVEEAELPYDVVLVAAAARQDALRSGRPRYMDMEPPQ